MKWAFNLHKTDTQNLKLKGGAIRQTGRMSEIYLEAKLFITFSSSSSSSSLEE